MKGKPIFEQIVVYLRCIDDVFIILREQSKMGVFCNWNNTVDTNIKFMCQFHRESVSFLDMIVYHTKENTVAVKPFLKLLTRIPILVLTLFTHCI